MEVDRHVSETDGCQNGITSFRELIHPPREDIERLASLVAGVSVGEDAGTHSSSPGRSALQPDQ